MFEKFGKWFGAGSGVLDQGQEMWGSIQGTLASLLDGDITVEDVKNLGNTLAKVSGQAKGMVDQLPEGEMKEKVKEGLDNLMEVNPAVRDRPTPLKEMLDPSTDIEAEEWAEALHDQLVGEHADPQLTETVKRLIDKL